MILILNLWKFTFTFTKHWISFLDLFFSFSFKALSKVQCCSDKASRSGAEISYCKFIHHGHAGPGFSHILEKKDAKTFYHCFHFQVIYMCWIWLLRNRPFTSSDCLYCKLFHTVLNTSWRDAHLKQTLSDVHQYSLIFTVLVT